MGLIPQSLTRVLGITAFAVACMASAATLTRAPYLQSVDQDSAVVAFRTDTACSATVRYGTGGNLSQQAHGAATDTRHVVLLENLTPATEYTYRLEACGTVMDKDRRFRTASGPNTQQVHFAVVADQGTGGTRQKEVAARMLEKRPEFWLAGGDSAYDNGTEAEFQDRFFNAIPELLAESPVFPSTGNHEYNTNQAQPWIDNFYLPTNNPAQTERYYSFDWGHVHVAVVDTYCHVASLDRCDNAAQIAWLKKDLGETRQPWKFVLMHHPPWSSGGHGNSMTTRNNFSAIFEQYGVDLVFTGHDHDYERTKPMKGNAMDPQNGIPYLVVGSGGAGLRAWPSSTPPDWSAYRNNTEHGFLDITIDGGTLKGNWITYTGVTKDSFTLTKDVPAPAGDAKVTVVAEPQSGGAPLQTLLVAQSNLADATYSWEFGDGQTGSGAQVTHTYSQQGTFNATVTAQGGGQTATATIEIGVGAPGCQATNTCPPVDPPDSGGGGAIDRDDASSGGNGCGGSSAAVVLVPAGLAGALLRRRRKSASR